MRVGVCVVCINLLVCLYLCVRCAYICISSMPPGASTKSLIDSTLPDNLFMFVNFGGTSFVFVAPAIRPLKPNDDLFTVNLEF